MRPVHLQTQGFLFLWLVTELSRQLTITAVTFGAIILDWVWLLNELEVECECVITMAAAK